MLNKRSMAVMLLLALFAVSAVSATDNATEDIVDSGETLTDEIISVGEIQATEFAGDDDTISETDDGTFTALQQKIYNAHVNDTITLSNNYKYDDDFPPYGITVDKDLTIDGQGYTIDGNGETRIFLAGSNHNVVFRNITFINGYSDDGAGGAIDGRCTAVNCIFIGNEADGSGGAMYGGSAVNCTFISNEADYGGAMFDGSAVNCDFNGNVANHGGAMYEGSADTCVFKGNTPDDYYGTVVYGPSLSVENYTSFYNSGDKLLFNLSTHGGMRVTNRNITIKISTIDGEDVGTFNSLSDGWIVPLGTGKYIASCKATDFDMEPVNATLTIQSNVSLSMQVIISWLWMTALQ